MLISTHSEPGLRNGIEQQAWLESLGVPADRIVIGHAGDSADAGYLRTLMDRGSVVGFDRFGMAHSGSDERRIETLVALVEAGYADRIVLSHDAAFYSHVTPPSWRAAHAPDWHMEHLSRSILPELWLAGSRPTTSTGCWSPIPAACSRPCGSRWPRDPRRPRAGASRC